MPNRLGYCGGDDNRALYDYAVASTVDAAPGDWVSLHWGWVCERITDLEQRQMERSTRHHLHLASNTL